MVPSAGHASYPILLPTDELELVLQDGQRCVRARHSLSEGLSWGPFHGNIQSRASSPGQVEPVRSPDPSSPPTSCRTAARAVWPRAQSPATPGAKPQLYSSPEVPAPLSASGDGHLRPWDQGSRKQLTGSTWKASWRRWHKEGFLEEDSLSGPLTEE